MTRRILFHGVSRVKALLVLALGVAALALFLPGSALAGGGINISPHHYNFGAITQGVSTDHEFTVTNTSRTSFFHVSYDLTQTGSAFWVNADSCGTQIGPGGTCTISIGFTPGSTGKFTGTLTAYRDGSTASAKAGLVGTGVLSGA
jgi:HYDIN/CFA65/VesB-like, Ig-like domain